MPTKEKLSRTIYITDDIDNPTFTKFSRRVAKLEVERGTQNDPVVIELISGGGDTYAALAFFDRIKNSHLIFHINAYGLVASAAGAILAAGDYRTMSKNSWLMIHEDSTDGLEGLNVSELERASKQARRLEDQWAHILASVSKTNFDKWKELHTKETYLTADECKILGICDSVYEFSGGVRCK